MDEGFDDFVAQAWREHADAPEAVAQRLAESIARVDTAARVAPYAALVVHVYGVHLAQWERGRDLLRTLRKAPGHDTSPAAEAPIARGLAALAVAAGDDGAADKLPPADRIIALANASSALLDREDIDRAIALFARALDFAQGVALADGDAAVRSLAVAGNNLAATLEDRPARTPEHAAAMVRAARAALEHWRRCGGWLEHERAQYRLARSLLLAGQPAQALPHAQECLQICVRQGAPALEGFFAHAIEAQVQSALGDAAAAGAARARAMLAYRQVGADEQGWCADELKALQATERPAP